MEIIASTDEGQQTQKIIWQNVCDHIIILVQNVW